MGYYSLSETVNDCSDFVINSCIGSFVRNPMIAGIIVSFITISVYYYGNMKKNMTRVFIIATALNTVFLFMHTEGLVRSIEGKDKTTKIAERFNYIQGGDTPDEFVPLDNL